MNKFEKLRQVGYEICLTCSLCVHGQFRFGQSWGTCGLHRYDHKKHDNPEMGRGVSIHASGTCSSAVLLDETVVGAHGEFLVRKAEDPG